MKLRPTAVLVVVLVAASAGWVVFQRARAARAVAGTSEFRTAPVIRGDLRRTLRLSGTVGARQFAMITAPRMSGRGFFGGGDRGGGGGFESGMVIVKMSRPGSEVKKGDVVTEFDRQSMLQRIDDETAMLAQTESDIARRKAELAIQRETADQNLRRAKADADKARLDLKTAEVRSEIEGEKLKLAYEETIARYKQLQEEVPLLEAQQKAEIRSLEIQRDQAKLSRARAEMNAEKMLVKTPIDGIVVIQAVYRGGGQMTQAQEGEQVYPGSNFMQIVNPSTMVLNAVVNQAESQELRLGLRAEIRLDAYAELAAPGRLTTIGAMATAVPTPFARGATERYVKQIPVRLSIDMRDPRIIPDLSGSATVILGEEKNQLLVPRAALDWQDGQGYAYARGAQGWERRAVQLGLTNDTMAVVRGGLNEGEEVALDRSVALAPVNK